MIRLLKKVIQIDQPQSFPFSIGQEGWYLILVSARVKSEKQKGKSQTDDDDLTVKIDDQTFPHLTNPNRLIDSPAAFSGGQLKNKEKSVYFLSHLDPGVHTIILTPDQKATVTDVSYEKLAPQDNKLILPINQQVEDGNRRPFATFALVDLPLISFTLTAVTYKRFRDSDDLKIIVDGEVKGHFKETKEKPSHPFPLQWFYRFWYFVGSILLGKTTTAHFRVNLPKGLHYIGLWADRKPILDAVEFDFGEAHPEPVKIQEYEDDRYNQYDTAIMEATDFWNKFFLRQEYPPPTPLSPNLVKAMIYVESRMGYGSSASDYSSYPDIMQVWDERNETPQHMLSKEDYETKASEFVSENKYQHMSYSYPDDKKPPKVETPQESIFWGVRWLYHKAQYLPDLNKPYQRQWVSWEQAVWNYNANKETVEKYVKDILLLYEKGIDSGGNTVWEK